MTYEKAMEWLKDQRERSDAHVTECIADENHKHAAIYAEQVEVLDFLIEQLWRLEELKK